MTNSHSELIANSSAQKRALSYANTILTLFSEVMTTQKPADRVVANYFREHKKHGSKDRRIIRETLFALFRWWGWLRKPYSDNIISEIKVNQASIKLLLSVAVIEKHNWSPIIEAWSELSECNLAGEQVSELESIKHLYPEYEFELVDLLPESFWSQVDLSEENKTKLAASMLSRPPIWARAQFAATDKVKAELEAETLQVETSEYFDDALHLGTKSINLPQIKMYQQGKLEIQDLASQVIGNVCAPKPEEHWWDSCSGAGGKSLQLASLMAQADSKVTGKIISSDIRKSALEELSKRAKRANIKTIQTKAWNDNNLPVKANHFDGVLVDAPCSCTGTWRRNPDMRWTDDLSHIEEIAKLQLDILSRSSAAVKTGGVLVYATCSLLDQENPQVVNKFLAKHSEFSLVPLTHPFTGEKANHLTIWPFEANSDGMFVTKFTRVK